MHKVLKGAGSVQEQDIKKHNPPFQNTDVEAIFNNYPSEIRKKCLQLRQLIFDTAAKDPRIGPIEETLKWGEPSYLPSQTKSGSMIRLHHYKSKPFDVALYFI